MKQQHLDELLQSLIQKAVRRGDTEMVRRAARCLFQTSNGEWLKRRLPVLVFEECWTIGQHFNFENTEREITEQLVNLAETVKNKNACGLGLLAYHLSLGDETTIPNEASERDLRLISLALAKPQPFWDWAHGMGGYNRKDKLLQNAQLGFAEADQPWDKAFMLAAVYLAVTTGIPETNISGKPSFEFPLWIVIDRHTSLGVEKITQAANQVNLGPEEAMWLTFYFEGAQCNELTPSPWWEQEKIWRLKGLGLTMEEGKRAYEKLKPILIELLGEATEKLSERILNVKI